MALDKLNFSLQVKQTDEIYLPTFSLMTSRKKVNK